MQLSIPLDPESATPMHRQLYDSLRTEILAGRLHAGERMPSTRALAESTGVSRTTIILGYELLLSEGYLESATGSGTYVSRKLPADMLPDEDDDSQASRIRLSEYGKRVKASGPYEFGGPELAVNFRHGRADYNRFPMAVWRRLLLHYCRQPQNPWMDYAANGLGHMALREEIARYLARSRTVKCSASQIVIVNGSQQALDLIGRVLFDPGDSVVIEDPCYAGARRIFESHGARLLPTPVDESGIQVDAISAKKSRLAYVTPSHQFPMGFVLSLSRRLQLLDWAERNGTMIVEDDYDSEYRYEAHPLPSMQSLNPNRVLYVGTFSKVLFPSLRIGYMVVPQSIAPVFGGAKWLTDRQAPLLEQFALADFIRSGHLERHVRRMRKLYDHRRRVLVQALREELGERVSVHGENAGMHVMVRIRSKYSGKEVQQRAAANGAGITSAHIYYIRQKHRNEFVLGYANLTDAQIRDGVRRISASLR